MHPGTDYTPLVLAAAGILTAVAAGVPALMVALANRVALREIHMQTDGQLSRLNSDLASVRAKVEEQHAVILANAEKEAGK